MVGKGAPTLTLTIQHMQETICLAHIYALAGMARVNHGISRIHDYGVDGQFDPVIIMPDGRRVESGHVMPFQAKSTTTWVIKNDAVVYDLEAKTYNDLMRRSLAAPTMLLILLCLPKDQSEWHVASHSGTMLRNCCYWHVLCGDPTANTEKKRIFIPTTNLLTADSLNDLLSVEAARREALWP
jgi:hypothetical protein